MILSNAAVILLVVLLIAAFPAWPHSRNWGYYPSAGVSIVLLVLLVILVARTV